jgi:hypothetical protein
MSFNLTQNILALDKKEQEKLFEILTENAGLLCKIIPNIDLLESIKNKSFNNTTDPVIQVYLAWKNKA